MIGELDEATTAACNAASYNGFPPMNAAVKEGCRPARGDNKGDEAAFKELPSLDCKARRNTNTEMIRRLCYFCFELKRTRQYSMQSKARRIAKVNEID